MADEVAKLGFDIDTQALLAAALAAEKAALAIGKVGQETEKTNNKTKEAKGPLDQFGQSANTITGHIQNLAARLGPQGGLAGHLNTLATSLPRVGSMLGSVGVAAAAAVGVVTALGAGYVALNFAVADAQDRHDVFVQRLRNALGDVRSANQALDGLRAMAAETGSGFQTLSEMFLRMARNADALGATNAQLLQLTETVSKLGIISGASQGELQSGMMQLGQALASGRLNGDELRSVMEQLPALARAIADGLGVSVGRLREMGAGGELTGQKVMGALLSQTQRVRAEFATLPDTVERAMQRSADATERLEQALARRIAASEFVRSLVNVFTGLKNQLAAAIDLPSLDQQIAALERRAIAIRQNAQAVAQLDATASTLGYGPESSRSPQQELDDLRNLSEQRRRLTQIASAEAERVARAPITAALEAARQADELGAKQRRLAETAATLRTGMDALNRAYGEGRVNRQDYIRDSQIISQGFQQVTQDIDDALGPLELFRRSIADLTAAQAAGGGTPGGTRIEQQVTQLVRQSGGRVTPAAAREAETDEAVKLAEQEARNIEHAAQMQERMTEARRNGRAAMLEEQAQQRVLNYAYEHFGDITLPKVIAAMNKLLVAARRDVLAGAADQVSQAAKTITDAITAANAQLQALPRGEYEVRRAEAEARASADRSGVGSGLRMQQFDSEERLRAEQALVTLTRERADAQARIDNAGNPRALTAAQERLQIERAILNVAGSERPALRAAMEQNFAAQRKAALDEQTASMREQLQYSQDQLAIAGQTGQQLSLSTAVLETNRRLRQAGVDLSSKEAQQQRDIAIQTAKTNEELQRQRQHAADIEAIWTTAAQGIQQALTDAFTKAFEQGKISGQDALQILGSFAQKMVQTVLQATVFSPLEQVLKQFGTQAITSIFGGGGAGLKTDIGGGGVDVMGMVPKHQGGMVGGFESGGRVVPYSVFLNAQRYHNGGMIGGDEVPIIAQRGERVLTASQQANMGGVNLIVNDMRGTGAPPIEQKDRGQGVDGKRMIEITVRDTTRKLLKSGDLDRDMANSYGASRRLTRR